MTALLTLALGVVIALLCLALREIEEAELRELEAVQGRREAISEVERLHEVNAGLRRQLALSQAPSDAEINGWLEVVR